MESAKKTAAFYAADLIQNNSLVGLGSGTTVEYFIQRLIQRKNEGLNLRAVASSNKSFILAKQGGLKVLDINEAFNIDITVDGADEIDVEKRMIKGKGGFLIKEKIICFSSKYYIIIADETKLVDKLGKKAFLPIEIIKYGSFITKAKLEKMGFTVFFRMKNNKEFFITENNNLILDIDLNIHLNNNLENINQLILNLPGVIDTGFFFNIPNKIIISDKNNNIKIIT